MKLAPCRCAVLVFMLCSYHYLAVRESTFRCRTYRPRASSGNCAADTIDEEPASCNRIKPAWNAACIYSRRLCLCAQCPEYKCQCAQRNDIFAFKFWKRMSGRYENSKGGRQYQLLRDIVEEGMKMSTFLVASPFLITFFAIAVVYSMAASFEVKATVFLDTDTGRKVQQATRYFLVSWLLYRCASGDCLAHVTCILVLLGVHGHNARSCKAFTVGLLLWTAKDECALVQLVLGTASCFAPLFPPNVNTSLPEPFFEYQDGLWCGMHCLNNFAGARRVSKEDCKDAARAIVRLGAGSTTLSDHIAADGNLSHEVISYVARWRLGLTVDDGDTELVCEDRCTQWPPPSGLLNLNNQHWTLLKFSAGKLIHVNSINGSKVIDF